MTTVNVCEMFTSIQGESSYAGSSCFFVRLAGCNLRCGYCDTPHALGPGRDVAIDDIVSEAVRSAGIISEITGGEPLMQDGFPELASRLRDETGWPVLVETNGSLDISLVPAGVTTIMDVKCPGSGEKQSFDMDNIGRLRDGDEVKFVICDDTDYEWARDFTTRHELHRHCAHVHFGVVEGQLEAGKVAEWILRDGMPVRVQVQLHKLLGVK